MADLIERECGVTYSSVHAWRILRVMGWTPQPPAGRALERNEAAMAHWKRVRWPEVEKTPKSWDERSSSSKKVD